MPSRPLGLVGDVVLCRRWSRRMPGSFRSEISSDELVEALVASGHARRHGVGDFRLHINGHLIVGRVRPESLVPAGDWTLTLAVTAGARYAEDLDHVDALLTLAAKELAAVRAGRLFARARRSPLDEDDEWAQEEEQPFSFLFDISTETTEHLTVQLPGQVAGELAGEGAAWAAIENIDSTVQAVRLHGKALTVRHLRAGAAIAAVRQLLVSRGHSRYGIAPSAPAHSDLVASDHLMLQVAALLTGATLLTWALPVSAWPWVGAGTVLSALATHLYVRHRAAPRRVGGLALVAIVVLVCFGCAYAAVGDGVLLDGQRPVQNLGDSMLVAIGVSAAGALIEAKLVETLPRILSHVQLLATLGLLTAAIAQATRAVAAWLVRRLPGDDRDDVPRAR